MSAAATPVGIAVVEFQGRFLVGKRAGDTVLPDCHEFPGGKCQPGESPAFAARRECLEETGLEVITVDLLMRREFTYPHATLRMEFWLCRPAATAAVRDDHRGYGWVSRQDLGSLNFPAANEPIVQLLAANKPG